MKSLLPTLLVGLALNGAAKATPVALGGGTTYDEVLKITRLQNAKTSGYDADGAMNCAVAAGSCDGGGSDRRLPAKMDTGTPGCNVACTSPDGGHNISHSYF